MASSQNSTKKEWTVFDTENEIKLLLSYMDKYGYTNTIEQIESLITIWRKHHKKIHTYRSIKRAQFLESFNTIKYVTMRNEFLERYSYQHSSDSWDSFDRLFFHLTRSNKKEEWSHLFREISLKTEMFKSIEATNLKLNELAKLLDESSDISKFYLACFMFLLAMEGIYDEIVRFVYATEQSIDRKTQINLDILKHARMGDIKKSIKFTPKGIFDVWDNGHRIRNAIAHARFFFSKDDKKMRFIDINFRDPTDVYTTSLTFTELEVLTKKIGVINAAFQNLHLLLYIYYLLLTAPEKIAK